MQDLTTGSVTRHLLKTTSFMLVTMLFQTLYFLADLYWVGRLGREAVAAVALAGNITFVVLAATQMLSVGTTTLIAHASGRRDQARANYVFDQSLLVGFASGVLFAVVAWSMRTWYASALAADAETARLAGEFLVWFIPAMALQFPMVSMSSALRGTGNFKPGMIVQSATVAINIVVSPMLMFGWPVGPARGISGAAMGTFVALVIGTAWLALYFRGDRAFLHIRPRHWQPNFRTWADMLKVGLPAGAEFALMAVYLIVVYAVIRPFGAAAQAGFGIGMRVVQASFLPVVALGIAVAPVAGQNFGAHLGSRVRQTFRSALAMSGGFMIVMAIVCEIAPSRLIGFFSADPQVIAVGAEYLRIVALNFFASGVVFVASSMFQAMGNTVPPLLTSVGRIIIVAVPVMLLARLAAFEIAWIWYISVAATWLQMGANLVLLKREFRLRLDAPAVVKAG